MSTILSQTGAVIVMNVRSLPRRLWMSLAAVFAVTVVVAVLLSFLSMARGFAHTLEGAGSDTTAIVTRSGSRSELNSSMSNDQVKLLSTAQGIAQDQDGNPIYSAELYVIVDGVKRSSQTEANIPMRGISPVGFDLRDNVEIVAGRNFIAGKNEIIVGAGILREFEGFAVGKELKFGKTLWTVVGVFSTGGSAFESELWADSRTIQSQFRRGSSFQTMRILLETPGNVDGLKALVESDPRLNMDVETETDFFAEQGEALSTIVWFGWIVSILMGLGALAGALNTMYTSVSSRATEIATLRAIGFSNTSAFLGTLTESVVLSLLGGVIGALISYSFMDGISASTMGASFTQVVFTFSLTSDLFINGITLSIHFPLISFKNIFKI
ncbi:MAG: FtsX-like permease family protein, partial [Kordiimonadaceae bacterium]|nr:FtsX-like permease family protein [Kordiimonadaceae bacterium]